MAQKGRRTFLNSFNMASVSIKDDAHEDPELLRLSQSCFPLPFRSSSHRLDCGMSFRRTALCVFCPCRTTLEGRAQNQSIELSLDDSRAFSWSSPAPTDAGSATPAQLRPGESSGGRASAVFRARLSRDSHPRPLPPRAASDRLVFLSQPEALRTEAFEFGFNV